MSEAKDDLLYISHVVDSIKAIELYTKGADFKEFCANLFIAPSIQIIF